MGRWTWTLIGWLAIVGASQAAEPPPIVGTWKAVDRHVSIGSLYQPVHGVRKRESEITFEQSGEQLHGHAVHAGHQAISFQERWNDGRTELGSVKFAEGKLTFEFDIAEWRKEAGPLAVESGRLENKGTIRVEATLKNDRLSGKWGMFLADGNEVFRGEWEAVRVLAKREAESNPQSGAQP
jgi:hypothetical protein